MSRPIGARIFEACSVLERLGQPATYGQIHEHMDGVIHNNTSKYCQRAVGLKLMTVDRTVYPAQYSLVPGWRGNLRAKVHKPRVVAPVHKAWTGGRMASVWDLGVAA